jgi:hypothetical protein
MRDVLALLEGQKLAVSGTIDAFSNTRGYAGRTDILLCLVAVRTLEGEPLTDHLWIRRGQRLKALDLHQGDRIAFVATVARYTRRRGDEDYGLVRPYRCRVLERAALPVPEPPPAPIVPPVVIRPSLPANVRIMNALEVLGVQLDGAPSLKHLYAQCPMGPVSFLSHLHKLAKAGRVAFQPDGRVFITASTEGATL